MDSIYFYRNPDSAVSEDGDLQGTRVALQPNISVSGWPTEAGSKALLNFIAIEDATIIQRLRKEGASFFGSTHMSEFGFGLDNSKAGEILKKQSADVELVLDLMGESRLAALHAGVCGFKPSYGLVSRFGLIGLIPSMECCGILSASIKNIRDILKNLAGRDEQDFSLPDESILDYSSGTIDPEITTVGLISEAQNALSTEQKKGFFTIINELRKAGVSIQEMSLPDFSLFSLVHKIVGSVEASSCAGRYDSVRYGQRVPGAKNWNEMYLLSRSVAFGQLIKSYLFQGAFFQFEQYQAYEDACRIRARLLTGMQHLTSQVDFLIFPAVAESINNATSLTDTYAQFDSMLYANVTGQPVLCLSLDNAGSGIQLAGPRLSDTRILAMGEYLLNLRKGGN